MSELRWHPVLDQWVIVATARQNRPQLPTTGCPFCPGSGRVPEQYDVFLYPNDFPGLDFQEAPFDPHPGIFSKTGAQGACDVVLYSPDHHQSPSHLSEEQWLKVIHLWTTRTHELQQREVVQCVQIFENTGEAVGVTMPHPHGQIYSFPFVPPLIAQAVSSAARHYATEGRCLFCDVLRKELEENARIVAQNAHFVAFCPYYGRFPSELHIYARRHVGGLLELTTDEQAGLAEMLSTVRKKYDGLYGFLLPLMMLVRQPLSHGDHPYFHFHIEFLPLQRTAKKLKFLAAVESGTGSFLNDTLPEEQAALLRDVAPQLG